MTWGKQLQFLLDLKRDGMDPQALRDRPILDRVESYYLDVFTTLSDSRNYSYGQPLSIPMSEIMSYFQAYYIESVLERENLIRAVQTLDRAYLAVLAEQQPPPPSK